jgi:hypothetical protein
VARRAFAERSRQGHPAGRDRNSVNFQSFGSEALEFTYSEGDGPFCPDCFTEHRADTHAPKIITIIDRIYSPDKFCEGGGCTRNAATRVQIGERNKPATEAWQDRRCDDGGLKGGLEADPPTLPSMAQLLVLLAALAAVGVIIWVVALRDC